jgi:CheY-like chemotaxis protein
MVTTRNNPAFEVLIADDQKDHRGLLRDIMIPEGFLLHEATSSAEALRLVASQPIHLFLFDLHLPGQEWLETVQQAQQVRWGLPCILLTNQVDDRLMRTALQLHVFSVLGKPINRTDLLHTTRRALQRAYPADWKSLLPAPTQALLQGDRQP